MLCLLGWKLERCKCTLCSLEAVWPGQGSGRAAAFVAGNRKRFISQTQGSCFTLSYYNVLIKYLQQFAKLWRQNARRKAALNINWDTQLWHNGVTRSNFHTSFNPFRGQFSPDSKNANANIQVALIYRYIYTQQKDKDILPPSLFITATPGSRISIKRPHSSLQMMMVISHSPGLSLRLVTEKTKCGSLHSLGRVWCHM